LSAHSWLRALRDSPWTTIVNFQLITELYWFIQSGLHCSDILSLLSLPTSKENRGHTLKGHSKTFPFPSLAVQGN
jgi:hypothetical protein